MFTAIFYLLSDVGSSFRLRKVAAESEKAAHAAEQEAWNVHDQFEEAEDRVEEAKAAGAVEGVSILDG